MFRNTILFLNGDIPSLRLIRKICPKNSYIICADGGANAVLKYGIIPDIILGDLDSINKKTSDFYSKKNVEIRKIKEQDTTDFEKSLMYIIEHGLNNVIILGALSSRPDHTMNNFSVLKRYRKVLDMKLYNETFEIYFINHKTEFAYKKNCTVSLMAMPLASGIKTKGLKYPLNNESLEMGLREGALNVSSAKKVSVEYKHGDLLIFKKHFL
ncbi:MAG: thiamine diphosphokinase [Ignavibacteria bacterium]|nr:thiamine diphosphokinase [Ignavibacteria bacterium]